MHPKSTKESVGSLRAAQASDDIINFAFLYQSKYVSKKYIVKWQAQAFQMGEEKGGQQEHIVHKTGSLQGATLSCFLPV